MGDVEYEYYAVIGENRTPDNPSGLVRRPPAGADWDAQSLRRDLSWGFTDVFIRMAHGGELGLPDLIKISESDADALIERFRSRWHAN